jgi:ribosomal protein S17E
MGRIKQTLIKRTGKKLVAQEGVEFNEDFDNNKNILGKTMPSKRLRNKIAGHISRLKKVEKREAVLKEEEN